MVVMFANNAHVGWSARRGNIVWPMRGGVCSIIYDEKKYLEKILFGHGKCDSLHCGKYCVTKVKGRLAIIIKNLNKFKKEKLIS